MAGQSVLSALGFGKSDDAADTIGDLAIGAIKGAGHTVTSLGNLVNKIPGFQEGVNMMYGTPGLSQQAFQQAQQATTPTNTAQKVTYGGEQAAEFFMPGSTGATEKIAQGVEKLIPSAARAVPVVGSIAKAVPRAVAEGTTAAAVTGAQGGDPVKAGVTAAVIPLAGGVLTDAAGSSVADALRQKANKQVEQFFGAGKERYKAMAQRLVPQMLARGVRGTRQEVFDRAVDAADEAGQGIDDALTQFGNRTAPRQSIDDALEKAKDAFREEVTKPVTTPAQTVTSNVLGPNGQPITRTIPASTKMVTTKVENDPQAIAQLSKLQDIIRQYGDDMTVDQLVAVRRTWDSVVEQAGGFAHRRAGAIGLPLSDQSAAAAMYEGTKAIRQQLDTAVPELTKLNKEYNFWAGVRDVTRQTIQRTGPQGPGLSDAVEAVKGAAMASSKGVLPAWMGAGVVRYLKSVTTSPQWRLASAQMKDDLATAIMSNKPNQIMSVLSRISAAGTSAATQPQQPPQEQP